MCLQEKEKDECFKVDLISVSPEGAKLGRIRKTIVTIVNDDGKLLYIPKLYVKYSYDAASDILVQELGLFHSFMLLMTFIICCSETQNQPFISYSAGHTKNIRYVTHSS